MQTHPAGIVSLPGSVVTIGAFDGVHLGHQALIRQAVGRATALGVASLAYTFDPPPRAYFQDASMLTPVAKKIYRLDRLGLDHAVIADFNAEYASHSVEDFLEELAFLNPYEVWVGPDFRFGRGQAGDIGTLSEFFPTRVFEPLRCEDDKIISSSRIRGLLMQDAQGEADCLLGWSPWEGCLRELRHRQGAVSRYVSTRRLKARSRNHVIVREGGK